MEIPKNCSKCPFSATFPDTGLKNGVCNDLHLPFKRHPYCPLVEIVTCKDCKWWTKGMCLKWLISTDEDFCCAGVEGRE